MLKIIICFSGKSLLKKYIFKKDGVAKVRPQCLEEIFMFFITDFSLEP